MYMPILVLLSTFEVFSHYPSPLDLKVCFKHGKFSEIVPLTQFEISKTHCLVLNASWSILFGIHTQFALKKL